MINSSKNAKQHANYLHHSTGRGPLGRLWCVVGTGGGALAVAAGECVGESSAGRPRRRAVKVVFMRREVGQLVEPRSGAGPGDGAAVGVPSRSRGPVRDRRPDQPGRQPGHGRGRTPDLGAGRRRPVGTRVGPAGLAPVPAAVRSCAARPPAHGCAGPSGSVDQPGVTGWAVWGTASRGAGGDSRTTGSDDGNVDRATGSVLIRGSGRVLAELVGRDPPEFDAPGCTPAVDTKRRSSPGDGSHSRL